MFNRKLFVYPVSLRRQSLEEDEDIFLKRGFYVHKKDLNQIVADDGGRRRIHLIFEQIKSKQPAGLSNEKLRKYFDREMRKRGFREVEFPGLMGVEEANAYYLYRSYK